MPEARFNTKLPLDSVNLSQATAPNQATTGLFHRGVDAVAGVAGAWAGRREDRYEQYQNDKRKADNDAWTDAQRAMSREKHAMSREKHEESMNAARKLTETRAANARKATYQADAAEAKSRPTPLVQPTTQKPKETPPVDSGPPSDTQGPNPIGGRTSRRTEKTARSTLPGLLQ